MDEHELDPLSLGLEQASARDRALDRLAELAGEVLDGRAALAAEWQRFEMRFGPELSGGARAAVLEALGREGGR